MPLRSVNAISASLTAQAMRGSLEHPSLHEMAEHGRHSYASLIGADVNSVAYIPNTSIGVSLIATGLQWSDGDEVIVPEIDFPSAVLPWKLSERFGVKVKSVPCQDGQVDLDTIVHACTSRTRVVCTSWVQFSSGHRTDLMRLGEYCRKRDIFFIVDGAQGVGALSLDVRNLPIDAMVTHGYKWLLGPQGIGWLYISNRLASSLTLSITGLRGMTPRESYFDHNFLPRQDATKFETGILDFHAIAGAMASIELLGSCGMANVEARITSHARKVHEGLLSRGWQVKGAGSSTGLHAGIIAARHPDKDVKACHARLLAGGVVTSVREGFLRISPHFYNSAGEIDQLLQLI